MPTFVEIQFKGPSREAGRLLSNRFSNMRLKLLKVIMNAGLKKCVFYLNVYYFFSVNTEYGVTALKRDVLQVRSCCYSFSCLKYFYPQTFNKWKFLFTKQQF